MDKAEALNIVSTLANGVNPLTGEVFPAGSAYQSSEIIRALFVATRALEGGGARASAPAGEPRSRSGALPNVGKPWTAEEDDQLIAEFERGRSPRDLAAAHGRTLAGIEARLEKLGRITAHQRVTTNRFGKDRSMPPDAAKPPQR